MLEFRLITEEDIEKSYLKRSKYGLKCFATDLAILLGGQSSTFNSDFNYMNKKTNFYTWFLEKDKRCVTRFPENVIYKNGERNYCSINEKCVGIRPKVSYSSIKEFCSKSIFGDYRMSEVEYGEYPQSVVDYFTATNLDMLFKNGALKQTGKTYTINNEEYTEYTYYGNKYIRILEKRTLFESLYSNGERVKERKYRWIRVEPIKWLVNYQYDIAISKFILLSGMNYDNIYDFMDKHFSLDIICDKTRQNNTTDEDDFNKRISIIINEIYTFLENVQNKDVIKNKVNMLLEEYETKLESIKKNDGISLYDIDFIKIELISKLELIIDKLKSFKDNNSLYYDILNVLDNIINYRKIDDDCDNSLVKDFDIIFNNCLPFLKEEDRVDISKRIINLVNLERNKLMKYLKYIESFEDITTLDEEEKLDYSSYEEFEVKLRKLLHPILIEINNKVSIRDIELEIRDALKDIRDDFYLESKNKVISIYLNEINKLTTNIRRSINIIASHNRSKRTEYLLRLNNLLHTYISYNEDFLDVFKKISDLVISLNKLNLDIEDKIAKEKQYEKHMIKIRMK